MNIYNKYILFLFFGLLMTLITTYLLTINYGEVKNYQETSIIKTQNSGELENNDNLAITYTYKKKYEMQEGETFSQILNRTKLNHKSIQHYFTFVYLKILELD